MLNKKCRCGKVLSKNSYSSCLRCSNKSRSKPKKTARCIDCGKELSFYKSLRCKKCSQQGVLHSRYGKKHTQYTKNLISKANKGVNHPQYIDGRSLRTYSSLFTERLKEEIRKRDNYECQGLNCSITQEEHFIMYGRDIEVHHIDYDRQNCAMDNLITLCKQCNIRANFNREYWRKFYSEKYQRKI